MVTMWETAKGQVVQAAKAQVARRVVANKVHIRQVVVLEVVLLVSRVHNRVRAEGNRVPHKAHKAQKAVVRVVEFPLPPAKNAKRVHPQAQFNRNSLPYLRLPMVTPKQDEHMNVETVRVLVGVGMGCLGASLGQPQDNTPSGFHPHGRISP